MTLSKATRSHILFACIVLVAVFLRVYKLSTLTTFGRDQGIDFATVKEMIVTHKPTLLGIKVSIAEFHQGPVYLYLLVPLFTALKFDPLAGAYTAVVIAVATLVVLYITMTKFFGQSAALWSSALFAVSPEFVREGNTPLYQHFLPLFLILSLYTLLAMYETKIPWKKNLWAITLGITAGICLELHFLAITYVVALGIVFLIKRPVQWRLIFLYALGLIIGVSPTLAFELRHQFLNTHLFWLYLTSAHATRAARSLGDLLSPWVWAMAKWFGADQYFLGATLLLMSVIAAIGARFKTQPEKTLYQLLITTTVVTVIFQLVLTSFEPHYTLPTIVLVLCMVPLFVTYLKVPYRSIAYLCVVLLLVINVRTVATNFSANHGYSMPSGWSLQKINAVTDVIAADAQGLKNVNIASLMDGDTRAYPLRYTLDLKHIQLDSVEVYPQSKTLYVVTAGDEKSVTDATVWEIYSLQPFSITKHWELGDGVFLYRIDRESHG